jgi:hypothetical protein
MRTPGLLRSPALRRAASRGFIVALLVIAIVGALGSVALIGNVLVTSVRPTAQPPRYFPYWRCLA